MKELIIAGLLTLLLIGSASAQTTPELIQTFLNQDPDPSEPGKYVELRWKIDKIGNAKIRDIKYTLEVEYPFYFDESDTPERNLGDWEGFSDEDQFFILFYKVRVAPDAIEDTYKIKLKSNTNSNDFWVTREYDVRVGDKERPDFIIGQITTSPSKLASDLDEAELSVEIANIGDGTAENVVVELKLPEGFTPSYSYSDREALGTIMAGTSKVATFHVDIDEDVAGGVHEANMYISYKEADDDDNELKNRVITIDLPLKDKPMFKIDEVKIIPEVVYPGTEIEMHLKIKNTGGEEAESVSIRLFKDSAQQLSLIEKSDFIGKLKAGEIGEAILKIDIEEDAAPKTYILDLEIRAVDNDEVLIQEKTVSFDVQAAETGGSGMTGEIIAGLSTTTLAVFVVILLVVGYLAYRSGKGRGKA